LTVSRFCGIIRVIKIGSNKSVLMSSGRSVVRRQKQATERPFFFFISFFYFLTRKMRENQKKYKK